MNFTKRLSEAGSHLIKADFENAFKSLTGYLPDYDGKIGPSLHPDTYTKQEGGDFWNFIGGSQDKHYTYSDAKSCVKAYTQCAPVSAILNRKAQCYINGTRYILDDKGAESKTKDGNKLRKLFARPNPIQSGQQFEAQLYVYMQLFGFAIVLRMAPTGWNDPIDTEQLWCIPNHLVDIEETKKAFYQQKEQSDMLQKIVLTYHGLKQELDIDKILIIKDFSPSFDSLLFPQSRIKPLELPINNIIGAYESRNVLINYRGALGMITGEPAKGDFAALPMTKPEKEQLQNDFKRYGIRNKQWQFIITTAAVRWQQMGVSTRELMLFEEIEADTMAICDAYGYPYRLVSSNTSNSLGGSDAKEFKAMVYHDAVIPESISIDQQLNQYFKTEESGLRIEKDFSQISVLQLDESQRMQARLTRNQAYQIEWENDLITRNMWRTANGEDTIAGDDKTRSELTAEAKQPLATIIGVGGVQALISVLTADLPEDSKRNTVEIVFGVSPEDAARMVPEPEENENSNENEQEQTTTTAGTGQTSSS